MLDKSAAAIAEPVLGSLIELSVALTAVCIADAKSAPVFRLPVELQFTLTVNAAELLTPSSVN